MFKTSYNLYDLNYPKNDSLTPIRDYKNDYFHKNDDKLPEIVRKPTRKLSKHENKLNDKKFTNKRPASLDLHSIVESLSNKKIYSPINTEIFQNVVRLNLSPQIPNSPHEGCKFYKIVQEFYLSEVEYYNNLLTANNVYRKALNSDPRFKNKLVKPDSSDELLLFGNIDTIASISKILVTAIKDLLLVKQRGKMLDANEWQKIFTKNEVQQQLYSTFDISEAFEQHLLRIKSTYTSYFVSHQKQMELFTTLRMNKNHFFNKWYEYCLKESGCIKLEDILKSPMKRLTQWIDTLETLESCYEDILSPELGLKLSPTRRKYSLFSNKLETEVSEYKSNSMYNFSLTPSEIIQSYDEDQFTHLLKPPDKQNKNICNASRQESNLDNSRVPSLLSGSSSYYSDVSGLEIVTNTSTASAEMINLKMDEETEFFTLADHISKFKKVMKGLLELKKNLLKDDLSGIIDISLRRINAWKKLIECERPSGAFFAHDNLISTMCSSYIDKLHEQKNQVTILKLTELETDVMNPLERIIAHCTTVKSKLKDLQALKKDYMLFLQEKKANVRDIKRDLLGMHFQNLQNQMKRELPVFITLIHDTIECILLNYIKVFLKYLKIIAGGKKYLQKDLENMSLNDSIATGQIKNLDILQCYSKSRYMTKRMVRKDWPFPGDPSGSRVVRKLFEL
ncbi:HN1_G0020550.mRNA.1.CDS.1 [Saccharomyces cerevisiae]|nr:HN1_G0020550.mRNA.1.CDS.1 [Saccharomyces cerevisiae]CAI4674223.1 BAL_1a_G0042130.mRNA.1.CDS.1 [Saccharomyces cerevisiae]CAI7279927.1 BAL_1a_G0042130.mRNA.1.CDS.1 [Saccharomyces cerevisiae]